MTTGSNSTHARYITAIKYTYCKCPSQCTALCPSYTQPLNQQINSIAFMPKPVYCSMPKLYSTIGSTHQQHCVHAQANVLLHAQTISINQQHCIHVSNMFLIFIFVYVICSVCFVLLTRKTKCCFRKRLAPQHIPYNTIIRKSYCYRKLLAPQ